MKVSVYLKTGAVLTYYAKTAPEVWTSTITSKILDFTQSNTVGKITPIYIDLNEIAAITTEESDSVAVVGN